MLGSGRLSWLLNHARCRDMAFKDDIAAGASPRSRAVVIPFALEGLRIPLHDPYGTIQLIHSFQYFQP
jgi:hypothetical protein